MINIPGFTPICKIVPQEPDPTVEIVLKRGRSVHILSADVKANGDIVGGSLLGVPGADCAVPLSSFHFSGTYGGNLAQIDSFPDASGLAMVAGGTTVRVTVAPDGRLIFASR